MPIDSCVQPKEELRQFRAGPLSEHVSPSQLAEFFRQLPDTSVFTLMESGKPDHVYINQHGTKMDVYVVVPDPITQIPYLQFEVMNPNEDAQYVGARRDFLISRVASSHISQNWRSGVPSYSAPPEPKPFSLRGMLGQLW